MISSILSNEAHGDSSIKVKELHTDDYGNDRYFSYIADNAADVNALLLAHATNIEQSLIDQEVAQAIVSYEKGLDPLHTEVSANNWQKIAPLYQTWDKLAADTTIEFLSRDKLSLVYIESTIIRISTNDKKALWGMTNTQVSDVNASIQEAVNEKASLDAYSPYFVNGVKQ